MKTIHIAILIVVCIMKLNAHAADDVQKAILARVTFYDKYHDQWGDRVACSPKIRAREGVTVAAGPDFGFGTKIYIPGLQTKLNETGIFEVQDRGSAVTKRSASGGATPVFDVFVHGRNRRCTEKKLSYFARHMPEYMNVYVLACN